MRAAFDEEREVARYPYFLRVDEEKGRNSLLMWDGGMPMPVSLMEKESVVVPSTSAGASPGTDGPLTLFRTTEMRMAPCRSR
jgi:hypothetical protein